MERRTILQLAALGMSASALGATGEPIRQLLALTLDSEPRDLAAWQVTLSDHKHAVLTRPPAQVRDGLLVDLVAAQRQLSAAKPDQVAEMKRVVAALSGLCANALTRLGDHSAAVHWWRTAKAAADASGDLDLRLLVRCGEVEFGLYGQRPPATVLQLIDDAEQLTGGAPSCWSADLAGTRAKAYALQGRHEEALQSLNTHTDFAGGRHSGSILPTLWDARVHFSASWVHAAAGREAKADETREAVLTNTALRGNQYPVNVRLHEALCTVANGGAEHGAQQATEILTALPPARRTQLIIETGRIVLRAVPMEKRNRPAVRELHTLTSLQSPAALS
ncbi:hypothetical protein [Actinomadura roseirufa]|uniref:hypothetical protein n=1 Tax=Actinomadura roseirufa TaxID=2094049 RepID=UPI00104143E2|nr:hypothetical protein [Actinomadura roseirufa]